MSHRGGQDPQPGYMDEVCVKISEKYKPPPRISLAITYAQRLYLNKQIQDNIIPYDFSLETSIKDRIKELRSARKQFYEDQVDRLRDARTKYEQFLEEKKVKEESVSLASKESEVVENEILKPSCTSTGVMYPTSYSNILTPTPLSTMDTTQTFKCNANDKSPFNISDFEADTSSPFDNMELKTINDIEELAQVLKKGESNTIPYTDAVGGTYHNFVSLPSTSGQSTVSSTFAGQDTVNLQYSPYISHNPYTHPISSTPYNNINGYYYNSDMIQTNVNLNFNHRPYNYDNSSSKLSQVSKDNIKNIPDIIKTLESELNNTHVSENGVPKIPSQHQESSNEFVIKSIDLDDAFSHLPKNLQYLSKDISLMGFPLSRVARVCRTIGDDQKKIVEHLLAMSELLDLGFAEEEVSRVLLQCNNDRDKALDILIS